MPSLPGSSVTFRRVPADFDRRAIERFARRLEVEVAQGRPFDCLLAGDAELRRLNCKFLGKDYATDVLSFPGPRPPAPGPCASLGDIAISPAVAKRNAKTNKRALPEELQILILHGLLHLLGYDHETDHGEMNRIEMRFRRRLGIA